MIKLQGEKCVPASSSCSSSPSLLTNTTTTTTPFYFKSQFVLSHLHSLHLKTKVTTDAFGIRCAITGIICCSCVAFFFFRSIQTLICHCSNSVFHDIGAAAVRLGPISNIIEYRDISHSLMRNIFCNTKYRSLYLILFCYLASRPNNDKILHCDRWAGKHCEIKFWIP